MFGGKKPQPLYDEAMTFVTRQGKGVFTGQRFQRTLRVGFVKAGSLLADLQDAGEIRFVKPGLYERVEPEPEPFGLVDLLARRPELRDVGIAGYLVGAAVEGAPGMPKTRGSWMESDGERVVWKWVAAA